MRLALIVGLTAVLAAWGAGRLAADLALRRRPDRVGALLFLHRATGGAAVALLLAAAAAWATLAGPGESGLVPIALGALLAFVGLPLGLGAGAHAAEAELRGRAASPARMLAALVLALALVFLGCGLLPYLGAVSLAAGRLTSAQARIAAPPLYAVSVLLGRRLASLLFARALGRGPLLLPGVALPTFRFSDLGLGWVRAQLVLPGLRAAVGVSASAAAGLAPADLTLLAAREVERHRLGFSRRRVLVRLAIAAGGSAVAASALVAWRGDLPGLAVFLLAPLLDGWVLVLQWAGRGGEEAALDRAVARQAGDEDVARALLRAHELESGPLPPPPALARRLARLGRPGPRPTRAHFFPVAAAGLATLAAAALALRLAEAPTRYERAVEAFLRDDLAGAERLLREELRHDPGHVDAALQLAWTLAALGRDDEAREAADRAVASSPGDHAVAEERTRLEEYLGARAMAGAQPAP